MKKETQEKYAEETLYGYDPAFTAAKMKLADDIAEAVTKTLKIPKIKATHTASTATLQLTINRLQEIVAEEQEKLTAAVIDAVTDQADKEKVADFMPYIHQAGYDLAGNEEGKPFCAPDNGSLLVFSVDQTETVLPDKLAEVILGNADPGKALAEILKTARAIKREPWEKKVREGQLKKVKKEAERNLPAIYEKSFFPMYYSQMTQAIEYANQSAVQYDPITKEGSFRFNDYEMTIDHYDKLRGVPNVSARKLFDFSRALLAEVNYYGSKANIQNEVYLDANGYAKLCGEDFTPKDDTPAELQRVKKRRQYFRKNIKNDLDDLMKVLFTGKEKKGNQETAYSRMRMISSYATKTEDRDGVKTDIFCITFDTNAAKYLVNSYVLDYPSSLLRIDNRNPNMYSLAMKMIEHSSIDGNDRRGTSGTISVRTALENMVKITSYEQQAESQRNWKRLIKKPLEDILDGLKAISVLDKWQYRQPRANKIETLDAIQAGQLSWEEFEDLNIDYIIKDQPDHTARRQRNQEKIEQAKEKAEKREARIEAARREKKKKTVQKPNEKPNTTGRS